MNGAQIQHLSKGISQCSMARLINPAMCRLRQETRIVRADANKDGALAPLRHAVIGCFGNAPRNRIAEVREPTKEPMRD